MAAPTRTAQNNEHVKVLEVCKITPPPNESDTKLTLPLTFFDTFWFKFCPIERIFYYQLDDPAPFDSLVLPKLKVSLSHTLLHFLPLAGSLTWDPDSPKPVVLYDPNDSDSGLSLTVAESDADMTLLAGDNPRPAVESHPHVPKLDVADAKASVASLQVTCFPKSSGFCIGVTTHHAILDGKSVSMFVKAWAHVCKEMLMRERSDEKPTSSFDGLSFSLPEKLTPFFDRSVVKDPEELVMIYLNNWLGAKFPGLEPNKKSLKLLPSFGDVERLVRATFVLSREHVNKLREIVLFQISCNDKANSKQIHLSTFVLTFAHALVSIIRSKNLNPQKKVLFGFTADLRCRLDPPVPENYFGNCVCGYDISLDTQQMVAPNALSLVAERLSDVVKALERGEALKGAKEKLSKYFDLEQEIEGIGVAGSPKFEVYESDFGWGKPLKVEFTSIDRTGAISLMEAGDGSGGVEVGVALKEHEMVLFRSLLFNGP